MKEIPVIVVALALCTGAGMALTTEANGQLFTKVVATPTLQANVSVGASWGDYDGDGYLDLYVTNAPQSPGGDDDLKNELFRNNGDGSFNRISNAEASTDQEVSRSSTWVDYDGDGDLDLYVSNGAGGGGPGAFANTLYRNDGGTLVRAAAGAPMEDLANTITSSWGDYDGDGDLDLFVSDRAAGRNLLYKYEPGAGFSRVDDAPFAQTGLGARSGTWVDYDGDGDLDLFILNFGTGNQNELYRSLLVETGSPGFELDTGSPLVTDQAVNAAVGVNWIDYDNDGDLDVFMATGFGNAINPLFNNAGGGVFQREIQAGPVSGAGGLSAGSCWGDYDNDGDLDLFVCTTPIFSAPIVNRYFRNDGAGGFVQVEEGPLVTEPSYSNGCANADYDNDGDLDLFVANGLNPNTNIGESLDQNFLYRNDDGNQNNWINISLRGAGHNTFGVGARVTARAVIGGQDRVQARWVAGGPTGDLGQNSLRVHFGLGDAELIDELVITWPSGQVETHENLAVNGFLIAREGQGVMGVAREQESVAERPALALLPHYPNPFTERTTLQFILPAAAPVRLTVYDLLSRRVATVVDGVKGAGRHEVPFESSGLAGGVYLYRLEAGTTVLSRTMVVRR